MNVVLDPAVGRIGALQADDDEQAKPWYGKLNAFRNLYVFLSQVIPCQNSDPERLYAFAIPVAQATQAYHRPTLWL